MKEKYYWNFWLLTSCYGEMNSLACPDCVNEDNVEVWRRYVSAKIIELMKDETLKEPEFQKILEQVKEDKRQLEEYDRREKELRIFRKPWSLSLPRNRSWSAPEWDFLLWRHLWMRFGWSPIRERAPS